MKNFLKSWGLLLLAIGVGMVAFFAATNYLTNAENSIRNDLLNQEGETVDVVVAASDLLAGTIINSQNLAVAQLPAAHVSRSAITPDRFSQIDGALLKVSMTSGEPLLTHFMQGSLIERFSDLLDVGERAVTIEIDNLSSNAGLLSVGDNVDIFLSGEFPVTGVSGDDENSMIPLFENVKVLAADRIPLLTRQQEFRSQNLLTDEEAFEFGSVTLALNAEDAGALAFASSMGDIVFLLRSPEDSERRNWSKIDEDAVLNKDQRQQASARSYSYFGKSSQFQAGRRLVSSSQGSTGNYNGLSIPVYSQNSVDGQSDPVNVDGEVVPSPEEISEQQIQTEISDAPVPSDSEGATITTPTDVNESNSDN